MTERTTFYRGQAATPPPSSPLPSGGKTNTSNKQEGSPRSIVDLYLPRSPPPADVVVCRNSVRNIIDNHNKQKSPSPSQPKKLLRRRQLRRTYVASDTSDNTSDRDSRNNGATDWRNRNSHNQQRQQQHEQQQQQQVKGVVESESSASSSSSILQRQERQVRQEQETSIRASHKAELERLQRELSTKTRQEEELRAEIVLHRLVPTRVDKLERDKLCKHYEAQLLESRQGWEAAKAALAVEKTTNATALQQRNEELATLQEKKAQLETRLDKLQDEFRGTTNKLLQDLQNEFRESAALNQQVDEMGTQIKEAKIQQVQAQRKIEASQLAIEESIVREKKTKRMAKELQAQSKVERKSLEEECQRLSTDIQTVTKQLAAANKSIELCKAQAKQTLEDEKTKFRREIKAQEDEFETRLSAAVDDYMQMHQQIDEMSVWIDEARDREGHAQRKIDAAHAVIEESTVKQRQADNEAKERDAQSELERKSLEGECQRLAETVKTITEQLVAADESIQLCKAEAKATLEDEKNKLQQEMKVQKELFETQLLAGDKNQSQMKNQIGEMGAWIDNAKDREGHAQRKIEASNLVIQESIVKQQQSEEEAKERDAQREVERKSLEEECQRLAETVQTFTEQLVAADESIQLCKVEAKETLEEEQNKFQQEMKEKEDEFETRLSAAVDDYMQMHQQIDEMGAWIDEAKDREGHAQRKIDAAHAINEELIAKQRQADNEAKERDAQSELERKSLEEECQRLAETVQTFTEQLAAADESIQLCKAEAKETIEEEQNKLHREMKLQKEMFEAKLAAAAENEEQLKNQIDEMGARINEANDREGHAQRKIEATELVIQESVVKQQQTEEKAKERDARSELDRKSLEEECQRLSTEVQTVTEQLIAADESIRLCKAEAKQTFEDEQNKVQQEMKVQKDMFETQLSADADNEKQMKNKIEEMSAWIDEAKDREVHAQRKIEASHLVIQEAIMKEQQLEQEAKERDTQSELERKSLKKECQRLAEAVQTFTVQLTAANKSIELCKVEAKETLEDEQNKFHRELKVQKDMFQTQLSAAAQSQLQLQEKLTGEHEAKSKALQESHSHELQAVVQERGNVQANFEKEHTTLKGTLERTIQEAAAHSAKVTKEKQVAEEDLHQKTKQREIEVSSLQEQLDRASHQHLLAQRAARKSETTISEMQQNHQQKLDQFSESLLKKDKDYQTIVSERAVLVQKHAELGRSSSIATQKLESELQSLRVEKDDLEQSLSDKVVSLERQLLQREEDMASVRRQHQQEIEHVSELQKDAEKQCATSNSEKKALIDELSNLGSCTEEAAAEATLQIETLCSEKDNLELALVDQEALFHEKMKQLSVESENSLKVVQEKHQHELRQTQNELEATKEQLAAAESETSALEEELTRLNAVFAEEAEQADVQLTELRLEKEKLGQSLADQKAEFTTQSKELSTNTETTISEVQAEHSRTVKQLSKELGTAEEERAALRLQRSRLEEQIKVLQDSVKDSSFQLNEMKLEKEHLESRLTEETVHLERLAKDQREKYAAELENSERLLKKRSRQVEGVMKDATSAMEKVQNEVASDVMRREKEHEVKVSNLSRSVAERDEKLSRLTQRFSDMTKEHDAIRCENEVLHQRVVELKTISERTVETSEEKVKRKQEKCSHMEELESLLLWS